MPTHSIYSVRDKKKVDAEVIDVREISGAKGVRYQIVGRHPEDGTTVTTFCSAAVAEDFRDQLASLPHGLSAENIEVAQDHIPEPEAQVISTDGTPVSDDLETFVEDPLVGSPTEGTLTTAKVLAAEGELSKTSCCCGATEEDPCACMTADEPMQCSSTEPKCACYAALDAKAAEGCPCTNCGCGNGKAAETVAGIDVQTPSQIAVETPDSDDLVVPDPDLLVNGDGRVLGQQTGAVNTTPMHAEDDDIAHASDRAEMIMQEHIEKGIVGEDEYYTLDSDGNIIETDDDPSGFTETGREIFEMFYSALVEGTDESDICYYCGSTDDVESCWSCDVSKCIECDDDEMRSDEDGHTYCDSCGPEGSKAAENINGHTEEQITFIERKGYEPDMVCNDCFTCFEEGEHSCDSDGICGCSWEDLEEYRSESPVFARNKRILVPTAVIGGLALAYLAKPELLSGSFDRISDMLGKLTKRKEE